jgi:hypothetical protein
MPLSEHNRLQSVWIPGYGRIVGNETVAQLAKTGFEHSFVGPEPVCGILERFAAQAIIDWVNTKHREHRQPTRGQKVKGFFQGPSTKRSVELLELSRNWLSSDRTISSKLSLEGTLFIFRLVINPTCERCLDKKETASHIL